MKSVIVSLLAGLFFLSAAQIQAQLNFPNLEYQTRGWGSCSDCAGGNSRASAYWMAQFQSNPSLSGASTEFFISGPAYSNALFWRKIGAQDWASNYNFDFWVYLDGQSWYAQTLEYDFFQFVNHREYMFGSQCDYASGHWDIWNQATNHWVQTPIACYKLKPYVWHHIVWQYHRTPDTLMHYDWLAVDGDWHQLNWAEPSGWLPSGWGDDMGVQWQLDTASAPLAFHEWIDKVNLKIW